MLEVWMTQPEQQLLFNNINENDNMLEYGSGGSTLKLINNVKHLTSIEHDKGWYDKISKEIPAGKAIDYRYVPSDKPRSFPHVKREEFESYINEVHVIGGMYDKVLIDGRARVWCAEEVREHLKPDALVFIHDWIMRPFYHQVLQWYKLIGLRDQMAVLRLK